MRYRLLALDLDGTAIVDGEMPTPAVLKAVHDAQQRGVQVVVATGRPYQSALHFATALGLDTPAICYQGALVKEASGTQATLLAEAMPREPLVELLALAGERGWELLLYSERAIYLAAVLHPQSYYDFWFGLELEPVAALEDGLRLIDEQGLASLKCLLIAEPAENDVRQIELGQRFAGRLDIVRSHAMFIEATALGTSKGRALAFLADYLGVPRTETIAVGDSGNDVSMIRWAGVGVAMGNGFPEVRAAADWVAPSVHADGVAAVIRRYITGTNGYAD